jgi:4-amino-4-deoxy-L-arabinose transferase-like glycosyltransferase
MNIKHIAQYTAILLLIAGIFRLAWSGQQLLLERPPDLLYGWAFLGIAVLLFLVLDVWSRRQQTPAQASPRSDKTLLVRILRLFDDAPLGASLMTLGIIYGSATFWLHTKPEMLPWSTLISWVGSLVLLVFGAWKIDSHRRVSFPLSTASQTSQETSPEEAEAAEEEKAGFLQASASIHASPPYHYWEILLIIAITIAGFLLRQFMLGDIPHNLSGDEGEMGLVARRVLRGEVPDPFATSWLSHPNLWFYLQALSIQLFGDTVGGLRMMSVIFGTASIPALYLLARPLYGRSVALMAAILLAASHFHIHYSRNALNNIADPLFGLIGFAALLRGLKTRSLFQFTLAGAALGIAQHFYMGARLLPLILAIVLLHQFLLKPTRIIRLRWHIVTLGIAFLLGIGPLLSHFLQAPSTFNARLELVGIFQSEWFAHQQAAGKSKMEILADQARGAFGAYTFVPDRSAQYDPGIAVLDPYSAVLFVFGIALVIMHWRQAGSALILAWLVGTAIFGGMLLASAPASARYVTPTPMACLVVALALAHIASTFRRTLPLSQPVLQGVVAALVLLIGVWNVDFYFNKYTPRNIFGWINVEIGTELGYYLANQSDEVHVYFFGPPRMYYGFGTTRFLAEDVPGTDMHDVLMTPEQLPPVPYGQRPVFVFLPERQGELQVVRQRYPEGDLYRVPRLTEKDELLFVSYEPDMGTIPVTSDE